MTSDFLLLISLGWVVTFPDYHRTEFTIRSWLDLLGVALVFPISILTITKLLQNCWHRFIDISSFEKHLENSLDHTLNFCRNLVIFRSKNMCQKEYLTVFYKLKRVKDTPNFISSGSKIVKCLRRRHYDPLIIDWTIGLVIGPSTALYRPFLKHCTLTKKAVGPIWRALSKPPQRRQGPDLRPLWLLSGTPSDLSSLPDGRNIACPIRMSLYIFLIYNFYYLCRSFIDFMTSPVGVTVALLSI